MKENIENLGIYTPDQELRALSWKQPFAELMLRGKIETRTWKTNYRGWVLICASKKPYPRRELEVISGPTQYFKIFENLSDVDGDLYQWRKGVAIAIGRLVDCRPMELIDESECFVAFNPNLFCHVYADVQAIKPIPWKGSQGWGKVPMEIKMQMEELIQPNFREDCIKENIGGAGNELSLKEIIGIVKKLPPIDGHWTEAKDYV